MGREGGVKEGPEPLGGIDRRDFFIFWDRENLPTADQPRTRISLKPSTTRPPFIGRPKPIFGLKREKIST
jgi:hypothetical protein